MCRGAGRRQLGDLLKICAKCIDGQEQEMNDRILKGLGEGLDTED
ncbi:hypothetical protein ACW4TU_29985 [Streptomyces sp. QTS52]